MYLTNTRPYICFDVNSLIQYLVKPRWVYLIAANHVMSDLKGTIDFGPYYGRDHDCRLYGYTNSYWARNSIDKNRTSGGCYCMISTMISRFSKKKSSVVISTVEAEYITACSATFEETWLWKMMSGLFDMELDTTLILCENHSCIKTTENIFVPW